MHPILKQISKKEEEERAYWGSLISKLSPEQIETVMQEVRAFARNRLIEEAKLNVPQARN